MDKHEALKWFIDRCDMMLQEKQRKAEDIAIKCIEESMNREWASVVDCVIKPNWEWISVKDRLPDAPKDCRKDDGTWLGHFLVLYKNGNTQVAPFDFIKREWIFFDQDVTHWMPLPDPPEISGV